MAERRHGLPGVTDVVGAHHLDESPEHPSLRIYLTRRQLDTAQLVEPILRPLAAHGRLDGHEDCVVVRVHRQRGRSGGAQRREGRCHDAQRAGHAGFRAMANNFMKS